MDIIKRMNIRIMGVPEENERERSERLKKDIIAENFPNLRKDMNTQLQEAPRIPGEINPKITLRHITIEC